ncbi:MAG: oxygen-dependent coproporphyrinogen oxidase [Chlamydiota bacterium]|nr:oxygen-dependent coproporphyrinogen oxidase [Chlamydiota bacterium]
MTITQSDRKAELIVYLKHLRDDIVREFQTIEEEKTFQKTPWEYKNGEGGGEISLIRGDIFEKAAVNWSAVSGDKLPMKENCGPFFATGVSLITHMQNPHAPTVHMNVRYIETAEGWWFGGGYDLTPMGFPYHDDTQHFHDIAKKSLDSTSKELYPKFSEWAKEYFYIPHRHKERGVGGIFFDYYNSGSFGEDLNMWKRVGNNFLNAIMPIYKKRVPMHYTQDEKDIQEKMRAHYVEFNLIYDRGTKFGFQSGGNPDAILCSMPPTAKW